MRKFLFGLTAFAFWLIFAVLTALVISVLSAVTVIAVLGVTFVISLVAGFDAPYAAVALWSGSISFLIYTILSATAIAQDRKIRESRQIGPETGPSVPQSRERPPSGS